MRKYGWRPQLPDKRDLKWKLAAPVPAVPVDLRPKMPAVYDQGELGSCTANEGAGAAQYEMIRQGLADYTPSRLFIYWNERSDQGDTQDDTGSSIRESMKAMNTYGLPPETEWPYDVAKFAVAPPPNVFADAKKTLVAKYEGVDQTLDAVRSVLQAGLAMAFGFTVYSSFESDAVAKTGIVPMPDVANEQMLGGHAVLCVGDEPDKQTFIVRNSWGADWGDVGYFHMPYNYLLDADLASDFWAVQLI